MIRSLDPNTLLIVDFTCVAPSCRLGATSDSTVEFRFALGDDTAARPTLTGRVQIGEITVANLFPGRLALVAGTALDANGNGDLIAIADSPNEGLLAEFVPEPGFAMQMLAGLVGLCGLSRRRRTIRLRAAAEAIASRAKTRSTTRRASLRAEAGSSRLVHPLEPCLRGSRPR